MAVTIATIAGVPVYQFSGAVTDAEIKAAWSALIVNGTYAITRAIYLDNTADMTGVTGGFMVNMGTQVLPAIILHTGRDKTKSTFNNFTFLQSQGITVVNRFKFVQLFNGTTLSDAGGGTSNDGLAMNGGGFIYGAAGNQGTGNGRYLNEMPFASFEGVTIYSQEFTEQELQPCVGASTTLKGVAFEKAYGFPQLGTPFGNVNVVVYRSNLNTQSLTDYPLRSFPSGGRWGSLCYVDSYVTRNNADITSRLMDTFGANASNRVVVMILNNYTRESWFGASKTSFTTMGNWNAANEFWGGVLKKLQFINGNGGVVRCYDSRSTTVSQKSAFQETGTVDFLNASLVPTTDGTGKISLVHIAALSTGAGPSPAITRYTGQKYTFQKFGYRVLVGTPDMTSGDNDLSAFSPISLTEQGGISRPLATINAATSIDTFQQLLEELHVLALGLTGIDSYNGAFGGNLFNYDGAVLTTSFAVVNVDATAGSKIAYNSATNTLTIKSSVLTSALDVQRWNNSAGVINLINGSAIQGVYQDNTGTSTVLTISGFDANSAVYVDDNLEVQKFYNADTTGTATIYIPPTATAPWYFAVEKYGNQRQSDFFTFNGGFRNIDVKAIPDVGITQTNKAIVEAYTQLENLDKIYDYIAFKRLSPPIINYGQIAFRDGMTLFIDDLSMVINKDATEVFSFNQGTGIMTAKSLVLDAGITYNLFKATPPATITPNTVEQINVLIEDANGDSTLNILGGDNLGYELWKVSTATATDDYATGTLLATLPDNLSPYRFIGISGFDIVGRDISSGVRRRSSMEKGVYNQAFYVGDQIQLATDAPQLIENNQKLDELILKMDTNMDVAISTRLASADYVAPDNDGIASIENKIDNLPTGITLAEIEASTILAKESTLEEIKIDIANIDVDLTGVALEATSHQILTSVGSPLQASNYVAPDNAKIAEIKTKVDTLQNTDLTGVALEATSQQILNGLNNIEVDKVSIAEEVWDQQPERLKNVATVQTTGDQIATI